MFPDRKTISHINDVSQPELIAIIDWPAAMGEAYQQNNILMVGRTGGYYAEECEIRGRNRAIIICITQQMRGPLSSEYPCDSVLQDGGRCLGGSTLPLSSQ